MGFDLRVVNSKIKGKICLVRFELKKIYFVCQFITDLMNNKYFIRTLRNNK